MTKKKIGAAVASVLAVSLGASAGLVACTPPPAQALDDEPLNGPIVVDYTKTAADRAETFASGSKGVSWENGDPFNVWWNADNVSYDNNKMSLSISEMGAKPSGYDDTKNIAEYYGGEERSEHYYGYGDYEVRMKPAKVAGTASTFFVCTGDYDVHYDTGEKNPHDEIDIEFLGKDTTKVQFNYFADDEGGHEYMYDLGFDASEEFHNYGFRWAENYIVWFVDGVPVYKVEKEEGAKWPVTSSRVIMNYWCGTANAAEWMGEFEKDYSGKAEYEWVKISAKKEADPNIDPTPEPSPEEVVVPTSGWEDCSGALLTFGNWTEDYTVTTDETANTLELSHTAKVGEWACGGIPLDQDVKYQWFKFKVKNKGTGAADVGVAVAQTANPNDKNAIKAAVSLPDKEALNLTSSKQLNISIAAGETVEVVLMLDDTIAVDKVVIFLNSMGKADRVASGDVLISDLYAIMDDREPEPFDPTGWTAVDITGDWAPHPDEDTSYTVTKGTGSVTIAHTAAPTANSNVNTGVEYGEHNNVHLKVTNNGEEDAYIVLNMQNPGNGYRNAMKKIKVNGIEVTGDFEWGFNYTIAAGKWINFDCEIVAGATNLAVGLDNIADVATAGSITVSEMYLKTVESSRESVGADWVAIDLSGASSWNENLQVKNATAGSVVLEHTGVIGDTYYSAAVKPNNFAGADTVTVTITNNGTEAAHVKVGVQKNIVESNSQIPCVTTAKYAIVTDGTPGEYSNIDGCAPYGPVVTVAVGQTVVVEVVFDYAVDPDELTFALNSQAGDTTASGNVTISEVKMKDSTAQAGE